MRRGRTFPYKDWVFRSNYEKVQAQRLVKAGVEFEYESVQMKYKQKVNHAECAACGGKDVYKSRVYTPDFYLVKPKIFVETKGRFTVENRAKMKAIIEMTDQDIRMVFMADNYLTRKKGMRYSRWCDLNNIPYAVGNIPEEWYK